MKKYFKLMSLFLGLMICTPAFVACGDDDDDDTPAAETPAIRDSAGTDSRWALEGVYPSHKS